MTFKCESRGEWWPKRSIEHPRQIDPLWTYYSPIYLTEGRIRRAIRTQSRLFALRMGPPTNAGLGMCNQQRLTTPSARVIILRFGVVAVLSVSAFYVSETGNEILMGGQPGFKGTCYLSEAIIHPGARAL